MQTLSPGKFNCKVGDTERDVTVPFGLKTELYKFMARKHLELLHLRGATGVTEATTLNIRNISKELDAAKILVPENAELVSALTTQLERAQTDAYNEFQQNRQATVENALLKGIDIEDGTAMELLSMILSKRDDRGQITERLDIEELKWSPKYTDSMEELLELLQAVIDYVTATVKKISGINQVMAEKPVQ